MKTTTRHQTEGKEKTSFNQEVWYVSALAELEAEDNGEVKRLQGQLTLIKRIIEANMELLDAVCSNGTERIVKALIAEAVKELNDSDLWKGARQGSYNLFGDDEVSL